MHSIIAVFIIFIRQINYTFKVSPSLRKLQITIPENCLYCILNIIFSASQITAVGRKEISVLFVYRNESFYLDNPENGWTLLLPKHWQPFSNVNDVISCKPVISSAPLWEHQSCSSNYKTCCISVSRLLYNSFCLIYNHAFLLTFSKVCALSTSHTRSVDVCMSPTLALLADTTLPWHSMTGLVTCWNDTNQKMRQAFVASSCFCSCHKENVRNVFHIVFVTGRKINA